MSEQFLEKPNLPAGPVSCVIVSAVKSAVIEALHRMGIRTISPQRLPYIQGAEAWHADMGVCDRGGGKLLVASQMDEATVKLLRSEGTAVTFTQHPVTAEAPLLNVCYLGNRLLCHPGTTAPELLTHEHIIPTRQRYAGCCTAVVSENAVITSDPSISRNCTKAGIDVLTIRPGHIRLDGYAYGFIGGCCGLLSPNLLAFSGNLACHPDNEAIQAFTNLHNVDIISLSQEPLYDIGAIIPLRNYIKC